MRRCFVDERMELISKKQVANLHWQERVEDWATPDHWTIGSITPSQLLYDELSPSEWARMLPKIEMVRMVAQYMLAGMVKGTMKYPTDVYTMEKWLAHIIDEGADQMNYQVLMYNTWLKEQGGRG
jgi:hypothetical protein